MNILEPYIGAIKALVIVLLALGLLWVGHHYGAQGVQVKWDADKIARATVEQKAIATQLAQNAKIKADQDAINQKVKSDYEQKIAALNARVDAAGSLRISRAVCNQPAAAGQTTSAGGADAAATVELPRSVEQGLFDLVRDADDTAAQLTALQDWIRQNGMAP